MVEEKLPEWSYLSDTRGIGGKLKEQIEDFRVNEIAEPELGDGDNLIVKVTKHNMTTLEAVHELSKILHVSRKRFGYAGNKDKRAVTTQYMSIHGVDEEDLGRVFMPDIDIEVVGRGDRINIGNLKKNEFDISLRDINLPERHIKKRINGIMEELDGAFPNYFGKQRFGSTRPVTHQVGRYILKGDFEEAVWTYIAKPYEKEHEKVKKVRKDLWETRDPERGAERFPSEYRYEKNLLYHLANNEGDYEGAVKRLPEGLQRLFVHAYQSYIFNKALSYLLEDEVEDKNMELPLVGYKTSLRDTPGDEMIKKVLEEDEVSLDDFKMRDMEHLRMEGTYRRCFRDVEDFELIEVKEDDLNVNKNMAEVSFSLFKGTYATVFLREIMKN